MPVEGDGRAGDRLLFFLAGAAYLIGLVLFFHVAVYMTDLAIAPGAASPCNSIWGDPSCIGRPAVLAAAFLPAVAAAMITWSLGRGGEMRWAIGLVVALVVTTIAVVVIVPPRCSGGLRLGIVTHSEEDGNYGWECIDGIE